MSDISQPALFSAAELELAAVAPPVAAPAAPKPAPRINKPERYQMRMHLESLDQRLDADHSARLVWKLVEGLDLTELYERIEAREGSGGRNASDPRVLFALTLYAAVDGVSSAREVARLCHEHRAYEWLRGEVPVNYHLLADFRVAHGALLKQLQTDSLAGLLAEGLIDLDCAAVDGMRVRAHAGSSSFRRLPTLEEAQQEARAHWEQLEQETETEAGTATLRQQKARARAAREKQERVAKAIAAVKQIAAQREKRKKGDGVQARASTTDPEARTMKMGDGGFRPAFNVVMTTATESGIILNMDVVNEGSDAGQLQPQMAAIKNDLGKAPDKALADGGFATVKDIEATTQGGTTVYAPIKEEAKKRAAGQDPFAARRGDSATIAAWRERLGTEATQALYKLRGQTAELSNARLRNQGIYQLRVRGLLKVKTALWWHVLAINLLRAESLRAAKILASKTAEIPCAERK